MDGEGGEMVRKSRSQEQFYVYILHCKLCIDCIF